MVFESWWAGRLSASMAAVLEGWEEEVPAVLLDGLLLSKYGSAEGFSISVSSMSCAQVGDRDQFKYDEDNDEYFLAVPENWS